MFAPLAVPMFAAVVLVAAGGVPTFDVERSCRGAAVQAVPGSSTEVCMRKEREARDNLESEWARFSPADKSTCIPPPTAGGGATYTELLTCLEITRDARALRERERSTTGQGTVAR
jgi:hypothetical protein